MQTGFLYDPLFLAHTQRNHPERRERLDAIMALLAREKVLDGLAAIPFSAATSQQLSHIHDLPYVIGLEQYSARGGGMLGLDTYVNASTYKAAALAAGACMAAVRAILANDVRRAFALVRPPGHHAFADHGEGFCLFNNIAFAAQQALGAFGLDNEDALLPALQRLMIVDWDVHHGNGTEDIFYHDPRVLYVSIHQTPLYPGTGRMTDVGEGAGRGFNVNIPLPPGVGDEGYQRVFDEFITPLAQRYQPQLMLVSAGYDAHWRDSLAHMNMSLAGFARIMQTLTRLSDELCGGRLMVVLEGGYDLEVLSQGVANTFHVLNGQPERVADPAGAYTGREASVDLIIDRLSRVHGLQR
jgi:acetoin utilization deacetylase AcuC-like enzyme